MKKRVVPAVFVSFFVLSATALTQFIVSVEANPYANLNISEAKEMMLSDPDLVILDVRYLWEYEGGHIKNGILIPYGELEGRLNELDREKDTLVYCKLGGRSAIASGILDDNGFKVYNMLGGISAWINAGYPIEIIFHVAWEEKNHLITTFSNSTISNFNFSQPLKQISFNVTIEDSTIGFCNVTIPKELLRAEPLSTWTVLIDDQPPMSLLSIENVTHTFMYFTHVHTVHEVKIIGTHAIEQEPRTWTVDDDGSADFHTIQEAVNAASPRDTIHVYDGTYYEHVVVNKTVLLIGENGHNTIVDGSDSGTVLNVTAHNINITGFTIQNSGTTSVDSGIHLSCNASDCSINNNVIANNLYGIRLYNSSNNIIASNKVSNNGYGIYLHSSSNNILNYNIVTNNSQGIWVRWSSNSNTFVANSISSNSHDGIWICSSSNNLLTRNNISNNRIGIDVCMSSNNNLIFHNNFINNTDQTSVRAGLTSIWDNGYPSGGNYWSDYTEADEFSGPYQNETGIDGIWDRPYIIDENNQDNYPLVSPYWYWSNPMTGDINKDMVVDMKDISLAAEAYGSYPDHSRWNPVADLNKDNRVDMRDLVRIATDFGKIV